MKKIVFAAVAAGLVLASCASAPAARPAAPAAVAAPAAPAAPKTIVYEDALPVSVKSFYPNGDPSNAVTMKYDARGALVSQETYNGNGVLVETRSGKAKGAFWRITVTNAQNGEVVSFEDRTLGSAGELLTQTFLNPKEVPQAANEYQYDKEGRKVVWLAKTGAGGLQARTTYGYDAKGNNVRTEVYDAGGSLTNVFDSVYDEQNHIVSRKGFDASQNLVEQTNFTWKDGRKVKDETVKPLLRSIEYTYGDKSAPTGIVSSVRGKVVERQTLDYLYIPRTKTIP
jgi:YD repeat-containing protein